jgi:hypothetical protein
VTPKVRRYDVSLNPGKRRRRAVAGCSVLMVRLKADTTWPIGGLEVGRWELS